MDWYCENVGTNDDFTVANEDATCNSMRYARYHDGEWKCFGNLLDNDEAMACIDDTGRHTTCQSGDPASVCPRDDELTEIIKNSDSICPGINLLFSIFN